MTRLTRPRSHGSALAPLALIFILAGCARSGDETAPPAPGASSPAAGGETAAVDNVLAGTS